VDTSEHNAARLHNCDETGITIVEHKHENFRIERQASDIFLQSVERDLLLTVVTCVSQLDTLFLHSSYFEEKI
jgi:hypothetical protein